MSTVISLVRRCKKGERAAFEQLFLMYDHTLYRLCFGYVRSREESLDIMQEVYIKIYQSIHTFDESKPIFPWMKRIAVNTCLNYCRDNRRHKQISLDDAYKDKVALLDTLASETNIEEIACTNDIQEMINQCIRLMPDKYRMTLVLRYLEDLSYAEIADTLDQPLGTIKSNLARGRLLLKDIMDTYRVREV